MNLEKHQNIVKTIDKGRYIKAVGLIRGYQIALNYAKSQNVDLPDFESISQSYENKLEKLS